MTAVPTIPPGMILRFATDATVVFDRRYGALQARRGETRLVLTNLDATVRDLLAALRSGIDNDRLAELRRQTSAADLLSQLFSAGVAHFVAAHPPEGRDSATLAYLAAYTRTPEIALMTAQAATVAVVGLGGLGCEVIKHLAALGVRRLLCVDHDCVEASNLNRQFCYSPADLGRPKVEAVVAYLARHAPGMEASGRQRFVENEADLSDILPAADGTPTLVVCCADQPVGQVELACLGAARTLGAAFAFTAMQIGRGYWGLIVSNPAMREAERFFNAAWELRASADVGTVQGAASWENSLLAAHLSDAIVRCLAALPPRSPLDCVISLEFSGPSSTILTAFRPELAGGGPT